MSRVKCGFQSLHTYKPLWCNNPHVYIHPTQKQYVSAFTNALILVIISLKKMSTSSQPQAVSQGVT